MDAMTLNLSKPNSLQTHKSKRISIFILAFLLMLQFANIYVSWSLMILYTFYLIIIKKKMKYFLSMPGVSFYFLIILEGMMVGLISSIFNLNSIWPYLRDVIRLSSVGLVWFIFCNFSRDKNISEKVFYRTFYLFCSICAIIQVIRFGLRLTSNFNLYNLREIIVINEGVLALGSFLSLFKPNELINEYYIGKHVDKIFAILIVIVSLLTFSRTVYLLLICLLIFSIKNVKQLVISILIPSVLVVVLYFLFPDIVIEFYNKIISSFNEISVDYNWNSSTISNNWRGYEAYNFIERFNSSGVLFKVFGGGFGTSLDVGVEYAHIVTGEDTLGYLHNGYLTTILKTGLIGLFFLVVFLVALFIKILKKKNHYEKRILLGMLIGIILASFFTISFLWSGNDVFILCVCAFLITNKEKVII